MERSPAETFRKHYNLLVVLGPTASGKTELAVRLAERLNAEIISADSRQVYRGMDLGTGKDLSQYERGETTVPHHLIDILDPHQEFNVFDFQRFFYRCFQEITGRARVPLLVGGTGLYLDAVLRGYRLASVPENVKLRAELATEEMDVLRGRLRATHPEPHNSTDLQDRKRLIRAIEIAECSRDEDRSCAPQPVPLAPLVVGIRCERNILRRKITFRLHTRMAEGLIEEVQSLHQRGIGWERIDAFGLEYRYVARYLQGVMTREEMTRILATRIHQFAKRQETWFRGMERKGVPIHWIDAPDEMRVIALIESLGA
ncbi:MAG: tRNA (adenosine(37)-N6)-dimethylallyltransferase MiaA [Syntrophales bacterium]